MPRIHIRIASDEMVFSAAHFLALESGCCEPLHGHTYRVAAEIFGPPDENQFVVDFLAAGNALKAVLSELDHRVLLPTEHPAIRISAKAGEVEATWAGRRWVFPQDDCLLLPIANTTTELLAQYVGRQMLSALVKLGVHAPEMLRIEIGEGSGFSAICEMPP